MRPFCVLCGIILAQNADSNRVWVAGDAYPPSLHFLSSYHSQRSIV